jgi:integrase
MAGPTDAHDGGTPPRIHRVHGRAGDRYPVIFVDDRGLPLVALTEWYRWCGERKTASTRATYASCLLRWLAYLLQEEIAWDAPCDQLQRALIAYHAKALGCQVEPERASGQVKVTSTSATPLQDSTLAVLRAAIRNFYAVLIEEGLYAGPNPLTSVVLTRLEQLRRSQVANAGAPDHAGIRDPDASRRRTPAFVRQPASEWRVNWQQTTAVVAEGIHGDLQAMIAHAGASARDRAILFLLLHTGARVHEIVRMSVGGYRADGVAGQALVRNKGSRGREVKAIFFGQAPAVGRALDVYLRRERACWDRQRRPLRLVADHEPFFLARRGTPYTEAAFYQHWYRLYGAVEHACPRHFSPHDLRHLMATDCLRLAREQYAGDGEGYLRAKHGLQVLMDWRSPRTVEIYDHSLEPERALALVAARTRWLEGGRPLVGAGPPQDGNCPGPGEPVTTAPRQTSPAEAASAGAGSALAARMRRYGTVGARP